MAALFSWLPPTPSNLNFPQLTPTGPPNLPAPAGVPPRSANAAAREEGLEAEAAADPVAVSAASVAAAAAAAAAALGFDTTALPATDDNDDDTMAWKEEPKGAAAAEQLEISDAHDLLAGDAAAARAEPGGTRGGGEKAAAPAPAKAYDCAAVQARGPDAKHNLPGETISELPVEQKQRGNSRYTGVSWDKRSCSWLVNLWEPQTKRTLCIGRYASEEDAARAYDCAAVQSRGPGAKRNFPPASTDANHVSEGDGAIPPAALVHSLGESTSVHTMCARAPPPLLSTDHGRSFLAAAAHPN
jgi:hypothetical protein